MLDACHKGPLQFPNIFMLPNDAAEHVLAVYGLLGILLLKCDHAGTIPIIGGDFNAVIGNPLPGDDFCWVLAGLGPEMIEAGCLCGRCWNTVCLSKLV